MYQTDSITEITEDAIHAATLRWLDDRGVQLKEIAELALELQQEYYPDLTLLECLSHVKHVLTKREVQNAILTGIQLDRLAERGALDEPLSDMVLRDEGLYGIDEILATAIINVYGSIGMTNYGYIDRVKPGCLERLDNKESGQIHTFLDDIVGAVAAAAAARLSHNRKREQDRNRSE
ncbi:phosphatidylglycerophosphatase A family protein [Desmospora profundinema]|uniref:Phosphatidylglycerophosphatase A n=1 Tax=Desmospora profundinema TaxID=1571184 RepID=A0ABU1IQP2_9BACL|nr:phosphatidylglycerophosphatase A [Desmospora profundinema]MDR6226244.1 phosphatidylglycerophosphatase A [Desmospora profundinema]